MRTLKTLSTLLFISLINYAGAQTEQDVFYEELGLTKSRVFKLLLDSYEQFLESNYPDKKNFNERTTEFLNQTLENNYPSIFDSINSVKLLAKLENSGLRKDICLYQNESYNKVYDINQFLPEREPVKINQFEIDEDFEEILPLNSIVLSKEQKELNEKRKKEQEEYIRTRAYTNENGLFLYALSKAMKADTSFIGYCEVKHEGVDLSLVLIANHYLDNLTESEYNEWKNKIPLAVDVYLFELLARYGNVN